MGKGLLIGTANTETVIVSQPKQSVRSGKGNYQQIANLVGGSAVNWAHWLHAVDCETEVFCPIGRRENDSPDEGGALIEAAFKKLGVAPNLFAMPSLTTNAAANSGTRHSIVIVGDGNRQIFSSTDCPSDYVVNIGQNVRNVDDITFVMIGNIPSDARRPNSTKAVLSALGEREMRPYIFANFGRAQYCHKMTGDWDGTLQAIDCLQLDLEEAKEFVSSSQHPQPTLGFVVDCFLQENINAVITLGRQGALGMFPREFSDPTKIVFVFPTTSEPPPAWRGTPCNFAEPTGAGDAFGAGYVATIDKVREVNGKVNEQGIMRALSTGVLFGRWACFALGGATICRDLDKGDIRNWVGEYQARHIECPRAEADDLLHLLDAAN